MNYLLAICRDLDLGYQTCSECAAVDCDRHLIVINVGYHCHSSDVLSGYLQHADMLACLTGV